MNYQICLKLNKFKVQSAMATFPKIHELNTNAISISDEGRITYNSKPLRMQTGIVLCSLDDKRLKFEVSPAGDKVLQEINSLLSNYAESRDMEHFTLSNPLNLTVGPWTRYFDCNRAPITDNSLSEFSGYVMLEFSNIIEYNGKLLMSIRVLQVLVRTYNQLPRGCAIFTSVEELELSSKPSLEPVLEPSLQPALSLENTDVNELLD